MKKVLIVDDENLNLIILRKILQEEYEVLETTSGADALEVLNQNADSISAVLVDLIMPEIDGFTIIKTMHESEILTQIPILAVTSDESHNAEIKALLSGASDFILKPYNPDIIKCRLSNCINLHENTAIAVASKFDSLTGLYVRNAFFELAREMILTHKTGYYFITAFDINNFKVINDQYGTEKGDALLKLIANLSTKTFCSNGGIACRISADNFALLYPKSAFSEKSLDSFRTAISNIDKSIPSIICSFGRYCITDLNITVSSMYDRASIAKDTIKGRFDAHVATYEESMRYQILHDQLITSQMHYALLNNQFEVWLQPLFNHSTQALIGAEALVRWNSDTRGIIAPMEFIPVFEKNGFIYELDKYVWEESCRYLRKWIDEGKDPLPISVNISRYDIYRSDFYDFITNLISKYRLSVDLLRLEITESAFSESPEILINAAKKLSAFGFIIEIDDFGSGYSSLNTLKDVPADIIKLDMRFLDNKNNTSKKGGSIIESVVRMIKWLGLSVIAEGVETVQQANYLKSIGAEYVQGYLYAKPMRLEDYEKLENVSIKETDLSSFKSIENLDSKSFWDPNSMDTLIFNSYIGAACIFEYYNLSVDMLRANDKYAEMFSDEGYSLSIKEALSIDWKKAVDKQNLLVIKQALDETIDTWKEVKLEFCCNNIPGIKTNIYIRATFRIIASTENRYLIYCTSENITKERNAIYDLIKSDTEFDFLKAITHNMLYINDTSIGLNKLLYKTLEFFNADRTRIFLFDKNCKSVYTAYECCRDGIVPQINDSNIPQSVCNYWIHHLPDSIIVDNVNNLDDSRSEERSYLLRQSIKDFILITIKTNNNTIGFMSLDNPKSNTSSIRHLSIISDYISTLLSKNTTHKNNSYNESKILNTFIEEIPKGFVRVKLLNNNEKAIPLFVNKSFKQMFRISDEKAFYNTDFYAGIKTSDIKTIKEALSKFKNNTVSCDLKCKLRYSNTEYMSCVLFVQTYYDENNITCANIFIEKDSENSKLEKQRITLLENIPCGSGIFRFYKDRLYVKYLNNKYLNYIGKTVDYFNTDITELDSVAPEDRENLRTVLFEAIKNGTVYECNINIYNKEGKAFPFHVYGQILDYSKSEKAIYTIFIPISINELSINSILPVVFNSLMKESSNITFIKDKDLKYVCASTAMMDLINLTSPSEIIGKTDFDLLDDTVANKFAKIDNEILTTKKPKLNYTEVLPAHDTIPHYADCSKYPLFDSFGHTIGIYCIGRDITEERAAYAQLKLLTNSIQCGLLTFEYINNAISLLYFNDAFCNMIGYSNEEFINQKVDYMSIIFKEDLPNLIAQIQDQLSNNVPIDCKYRVHTKNNATKWIKMKSNPIDSHSNKKVLIAVIFDITDEINTFDKLRMNEEELNIALYKIGKVIAVYDALNHTISFPDEYAKEHRLPLFLSNLPNSISKCSCIKKADIPLIANLFIEIENGKTSTSTELHMECIDGTIILERFEAFTVLNNNNKPEKSIIVIEDITQQREQFDLLTKENEIANQEIAEYKNLLFDASVNKYANVIKIDIDQRKVYQIKFDNGSPIEEFINSDWNSFYKKVLSYIYVDDRNLVNQKAKYGKLDAFKENDIITLTYRGVFNESIYHWYNTTIRYSIIEEEISSGNTTKHHYLTVFSTDITEDINEKERLQDLGEHDGLTDLFNKTKFQILLNSEYKNLNSCGVLFLDLNDLKEINDTWGHNVGDVNLRQIADSIRSITSRKVHGYRFGGDEFVVIACNTTELELDKLLNMFYARLQILSTDNVAPCNVASGKVWSNNKPIHVNVLINEADRDMYQNKMKTKRKNLYSNRIRKSEKDWQSLPSNSFCDTLKEYGIDVATLTERFSGDFELYKLCLHQFIEDDFIEKIQKHLSKKDYKSAIEDVHTLKGTSGNMGLTPLYNAVSELYQSLYGNNYSNISSQFENIISEYNKIRLLVISN